MDGHCLFFVPVLLHRFPERIDVLIRVAANLIVHLDEFTGDLGYGARVVSIPGKLLNHLPWIEPSAAVLRFG